MTGVSYIVIYPTTGFRVPMLKPGPEQFHNCPRNQTGFISAKILNLKGQLINIIDLEYKIPGNYSITWDGSLQPSGMYLFVLDNQTSRLTQNIMLVK